MGEHFKQGVSCASIESVKITSDAIIPVSGEIVAVNETLADAPELLNDSPYDKGWLVRVKPDDADEGGRISAAAAAVGTMLQIKPLLHVDDEGKLRVAEKPRGRKQAIRTQIAHMKEGWTPEMGRLVVIGHGDCPEDAEQLRQAVLREFPDADIRTAYIGPIIGAHTGPGMLALIYWGANR